MPKLRHGPDDLSKLAQWLGRKCRNHNPLEELKLPAGDRAALPSMHKAKEKGKVHVVKNDRAKLVYFAAGRSFMVTVEEIPAETFKEAELEICGY